MKEFLKTKSRFDERSVSMRAKLRRLGLRTVCEEARCPNLGECFGRGTATFMILGRICSRDCKFCAVEKGLPEGVDENEPMRVAEMALELGLRHIVITSVTRDDLEDGGAEQFYRSVIELRRVLPEASVEVLTPDFQGRRGCVERVLEAMPDVYNHNIETVPGLYPLVRQKADYYRSLSVLKFASEFSSSMKVKSGLMVGMGESRDEIEKVMNDLLEAGCRILTIGQYLAPSRKHFPVVRYYEPEEYEELKELGMRLGFEMVYSGPLVRSSFNAGEIFDKVCNDRIKAEKRQR